MNAALGLNTLRLFAAAWASLLLFAGCLDKTAQPEIDCFPPSAGYKPPATSGYQICAKTVWNTSPSAFKPVEAIGREGSTATYYFESEAFEPGSKELTEFLPLVGTEGVNGTLCRKSFAFPVCRVSTTYAAYGGTEISVRLQKTVGDIQCRSLNTYNRRGVSRFTVCDQDGSAFLEQASLFALSRDARRAAG